MHSKFVTSRVRNTLFRTILGFDSIEARRQELEPQFHMGAFYSKETMVGISGDGPNSFSSMSTRVVNSFDQIKGGEFKRTATDFHRQIEEGGEFPPESGRYVLYVSLACPWAHRCLITRALKGLTNVIDVVVVDPVWGVVDEESQRQSWVFSDSEVDGFSVKDTLLNQPALRGVYETHDPSYEGRYTVPVLFDTQTNQIVNNESAEIVRILDEQFNHLAENPDFTLRPAPLAGTPAVKEDGSAVTDESGKPLDVIEAAMAHMYPLFNNGVYRAGFAQSQEAYEAGVADVEAFLEEMEQLLQKQRFVCGDQFTEADVRMWVTACRFDPVYHTHFKCAFKRLEDYPAVYGWLCDVFFNIFNDEARKSYSETHIKQHYYRSHPLLNKFGIVPRTGRNALTDLEDGIEVAQQRAKQFTKEEEAVGVFSRFTKCF